MTRFLIACDFDGTVTRRDTLDVIVSRFGDRTAWDRMEGPLRRGEVSVEEAMQTEFDTVRATHAQVMDEVVREAGMREGFPEFVAWARDRGHRLVITSNGFRSVIAHLLDRAGLADLPVHAHDASFSATGARLMWTDRGERCGICSRPCKRSLLHALRDTEPVVLIGDGISDRCGAGVADAVFARDDLAEWLGERGAPFTPFEDFHAVREGLDALARRAA